MRVRETLVGLGPHGRLLPAGLGDGGKVALLILCEPVLVAALSFALLLHFTLGLDSLRHLWPDAGSSFL